MIRLGISTDGFSKCRKKSTTHNLLSYYLDHEPESYSTLDQNRFYENDNCVFDIAIADQERPIFDKISSVSEQLGSFSEILTGTPAIEYFYGWGDLLVTEVVLNQTVLHCHLSMCQMSTDMQSVGGKEVRAAKKKLSKPYLLFHPRYVGRNKWSVFSIRPKIVIAGTAKRLTAALDETGYANLSLYAVVRWQDNKSFHINYLLWLLNSRLIDYWFKKEIRKFGYFWRISYLQRRLSLSDTDLRTETCRQLLDSKTQ